MICKRNFIGVATMTTVGFILLTHNKPQQVLRLINTLNRMFEYPQIACHHDFSKSALSKDSLIKNVSFVCPHLQTGWGNFSLVEAMLQALQLMYKNPNSPDWFILLSGADYPIKPAKQILDELASSKYDVHMHYEQITHHILKNTWQESCYKRYCFVRFQLPLLNRNIQVTLKNPLLTAPFLPFSKNMRCFAGEHWFFANRRAAEYLIEFHKNKPGLASHYRSLDPYTIIPEESYYQTVFCNAPHLKVSQGHLRYIDWSSKGSHPKTLGMSDLPRIKASPAHFARKFDIDVDYEILNEIDTIIG